MRPTGLVRLTAVGVSAWVPFNYLQSSPNGSVAVIEDSGATSTYTVDHTFDDITTKHNVTLVQAANTITVTDPGHGLSVGDGVVIDRTGGNGVDGNQVVASVTNANVYTITSPVSQAFSSNNGYAANLRAFALAGLTAQTTRQYASYPFPIMAVRLRLTVLTGGAVTMIVLSGVGV